MLGVWPLGVCLVGVRCFDICRSLRDFFASTHGDTVVILVVCETSELTVVVEWTMDDARGVGGARRSCMIPYVGLDMQ